MKIQLLSQSTAAISAAKQKRLPPQAARLPALENAAGQHREQGHHGAEQEGGRSGQPPGHAAEDGEADVNPGNAGQEEAEAERQAAQGRLPRRSGAAQQLEEAEPDQRGQPEQAERGEAQHAGDPGGRGDEVAHCRVSSQ